MKAKISIPMIAVILGTLVTIAFSSNPSLRKCPGAREACAIRTGLKKSEISSYATKYNGCTLDCLTKYGDVFSHFALERLICNKSLGYKCHLGKCVKPYGADDYPSNLHKIKIAINSAYVSDENDLPTAGASDYFVAISVEHFGKPIFEDEALICSTYPVQGDNFPRWKFACRPPPVRLNTVLRFDVIDSDESSNHTDILGTAIESVEHLINHGPTRLDLKVPGMEGASFFLDVEITGINFRPWKFDKSFVRGARPLMKRLWSSKV